MEVITRDRPAFANVQVKMEAGDRIIAEADAMALNVPTYINLYGYGYRNVYELDELVDVSDPRIQFAGSLITGTDANTLDASEPIEEASPKRFWRKH